MKKKITILLIIFVTLTLVVAGCSTEEQEKPQEQEAKIPVEINTVEKKTISNEITLSGKAKPSKDIMVMPKMAGKVSKVNVDVGDNVNKGDVLFSLDKDDINNQVEQAKAALNAAKSNYQMTKEKIDNAKKNFERTKELYEEGAVSESKYEQAKLAASDSSLAAAQSNVEQARVGYNQALDALDNAVITSPISGTVSTVNIEAGEFATNAQPSLVIVDNSNLNITMNVTEDLVDELYVGKEVTIDINTLSVDNLSGKIVTISPTQDQRTQLYPVKIQLNNNVPELKSGMFAKIVLDTDIKENVISIKSEAILDDGERKIVFVVEGGVAKEKEVSVGLDTGYYTEITSGIKVGEKVIVKGQNYVEKGSKVDIVRGEE